MRVCGLMVALRCCWLLALCLWFVFGWWVWHGLLLFVCLLLVGSDVVVFIVCLIVVLIVLFS